MLTLTIKAEAAQTVTYTKGDIVDGTMEFRYITIVETKWTGLKTVAGQPKNGTYLKVGDQLSYADTTGGTNTTLSIGIGPTYGYSAGSVSFTIPLGKAVASKTFGVAKTANEKGYYLLKAKKKVKCTVKLSQYRTVRYTYDSSKKKSYYKATSDWGHTTLAKKSKEILKVYPMLVKQ